MLQPKFRLLFALCLPLSACGQTPPVNHVSSIVNAGPFKTTGQKFFISSQCSPHSTSYELAVNSESLVGRTYNMYGLSKTQTLDLNTHILTVTTTKGATGPAASTDRVVLLPGADSDAPAYGAALVDLRKVVSSVKDGNVCFGAKPELAEVEAFLAGLTGR